MSIRDPRDFEDERPIGRGGYHHYKSSLRDTNDDWGGLPKPCDLGSLKSQLVRLTAMLADLATKFNEVAEERDELKLKNDVATDNAHMYCEEIRHWKKELDLLQKRHDGEQKAKAKAERASLNWMKAATLAEAKQHDAEKALANLRTEAERALGLLRAFQHGYPRENFSLCTVDDILESIARTQ